MIPRSWLFVPANSPRKLEKAATLGADALILDLEDAVPPHSKSEARDLANRWLLSQPNEIAVWVRVNNASGTLEQDLRVFVTAQIRGIVVPKVEDARAAAEISELITQIEMDKGLEPGEVSLLPMVETGHAVLNAYDIASVDRVVTLMMGQYDLAAELGVRLPEADALSTARALLVLACAAARKIGPVAPVSGQFRDIETFRHSTIQLRDEGHSGRAVIHPTQVGPTNEIYSPTGEELDAIRKMRVALRQADSDGQGVVIDEEGNLIDNATLRLAERFGMPDHGTN